MKLKNRLMFACWFASLLFMQVYVPAYAVDGADPQSMAVPPCRAVDARTIAPEMRGVPNRELLNQPKHGCSPIVAPERSPVRWRGRSLAM